jgi:FAD/FMN-containing dehydrogenase
MDRRTFLRHAGRAGAAAAAVTVAGCSSSPASSSGSSTSTRPSTEPTSTSGAPGTSTQTTATTGTTRPATGPSTADWTSFGRSLEGEVVLPGEPGFATDALLYNPVFDGIVPKAVAYCASTSDVAATVGFAREHSLPFSLRAGGHSYAGYSTSTGLVLDVTRMGAISIPSGSTTASVGAGARLVDVYSACAGAGVAIPGGSCPTVGIAGLALGGGVGVVGRMFGLASDNMLSAQVVTASGSVLTASQAENSDLYWALRGAGGGNFGVVTSFEFSTHPVSELGLFTLVFEWSNAAAVLSAWQAFAPSAPDELWCNCLLLASQHTPSGYTPSARVTGVYVGSESALESALQPFLDSVGAQPFDHFVGSAGYLDAMLIEAGCDGDTVPECHLPSQNPAGVLTRSPFAAKSDYLASPLPQAGIATLLAAVEARQTSPILSGGGVAFDASGGAINRVAPDATAFVHRSELASVQYSGNWGQGAAQSVISANQAWLASTWQSMRPYMSGQAYQNYIDPQLPNWQQAYYGSNYERLTQVKAKYDPEDVFRFAQGIARA